MNIALNCSWSGTTVCTTGYGGNDRSEICFIGRLDKLIDSDYFEKTKIDTIFIFGGTNDSNFGSPIGSVKFSDWTVEDKKSFAPAFCYMLNRLKTELPDIRVINIMNTNLLPDISSAMVSACDHFKVENIVLNNISKISGHPSVAGMEQICDQIVNYLKTPR